MYTKEWDSSESEMEYHWYIGDSTFIEIGRLSLSDVCGVTVGRE